ncbi:hypothetical protein AMTRI_Chr01g107550 [Amborella trichopoda]
MRCAEAHNLVLTTHTARVCLVSAYLWTVDALCLGAQLNARHPCHVVVPSSCNPEALVSLCLGTHLRAHQAYILGVPISATGRASRCRVPRCPPRCPPATRGGGHRVPWCTQWGPQHMLRGFALLVHPAGPRGSLPSTFRVVVRHPRMQHCAFRWYGS